MLKLWGLIKVIFRREINALHGKRLTEQGRGLLQYCYNIARDKEEANCTDYRSYIYEQAITEMQEKYNLPSRKDAAALLLKILIEFKEEKPK